MSAVLQWLLVSSEGRAFGLLQWAGHNDGPLVDTLRSAAALRPQLLATRVHLYTMLGAFHIGASPGVERI